MNRILRPLLIILIIAYTISPLAAQTTGKGTLISYNPRTGKETKLEEQVRNQELPYDFIGGNIGILFETANNIQRENRIFNFGSLDKIDNPAVFPWSVNVKLFMKSRITGTDLEASGILIDSKHVLTAGHNVFEHNKSKNTKDWMESIRVIPGYENGNEPFGRANGANWYAWDFWIDNENYGWDLGIILLDRPIGALTGWHGYGYNDDHNFFLQANFHNPGYPNMPPYNAKYLLDWQGTFDEFAVHQLSHNNRTYHGHSGAGCYTIRSNNYVVYSVLSIGSQTESRTIYTRINYDKYVTINNQISSNTPSQPDLIPLRVHITPSSINAGDQLSSMNYILHNYSSNNWTTPVTVKVFISTDESITTDDELIQTHRIQTNFAPKSIVLVNVSAPLPSIPSDKKGQYWIGLILDINDSNTINNSTNGWDAFSINVLQPVSVANETHTSSHLIFGLNQNWPNPFNPSTTIRYTLPKTVVVKLKVFNLLGEEIETLVNDTQMAGKYEIQWNPDNLMSGLYFYRLTAGEFTETRKMILSK